LSSALRPDELIYRLVLGISAIPFVQVLNLVSYLAVILAGIKLMLRPIKMEKAKVYRLVLLFGLICFHFLFCASMLNQVESGIPFVGLIAGLSVASLRDTIGSVDIRFTSGTEPEQSYRLEGRNAWLSVPLLWMFLLLFVQGVNV